MEKIAIDMDEVIADAVGKFIKLYNRDFNVPLDLKIDAGNEIYHHVPQDVNQKWFEYINEPGFFRDLDVIADSQRVIKALQQKYDVYIVSAAMEFRNSLVDKYDWLAEHFSFIDWQHIMFCGNKIVNVDIIIDDRTKNFINFTVRPLLFTSPHNLLVKEYERVNSWEEVADLLL
ncbi:5'(3')-deoxyribonucleotidase [Pedobacter sp. PF22-3]|uniref:5' nucleotidase, NT5C type n=1 Tax=Pedobacter sp. PF22-3 TaxID=2994467 RepID=UPI002246B62C|nr:5'(3')-deoxyribonucleotidase [Pedobacter sp. PF22-3]MCX2493547.1 5'(3')-deoxyribonucleotidase [Pedobacter sp. PF22-3]